MSDKRKKIESGRISTAYRFAENGIGKSKKDYKGYAKSLPAMIKSNGLAATCAFMFSKGGTYRVFYDQLDEWLSADECIVSSIYKSYNDKGTKLIKKLTEMNSADYRAITNEVMSLFTWLRRFAEGLAKEKDNEQNCNKD